MGRRITILDDATALEVSVYVEPTDEGSTKITSVTLACPDGLTGEALLTLEEFGLRVPAPITGPSAPKAPRPRTALPAVLAPSSSDGQPAGGGADPPSAPPPSTVPAKKATKATKAAQPANKPTRPYRQRPSDAVLLSAYTETGRSTKNLAARFDVPVHTAQGWVGHLRKSGLLDRPAQPVKE